MTPQEANTALGLLELFGWLEGLSHEILTEHGLLPSLTHPSNEGIWLRALADLAAKHGSTIGVLWPRSEGANYCLHATLLKNKRAWLWFHDSTLAAATLGLAEEFQEAAP